MIGPALPGALLATVLPTAGARGTTRRATGPPLAAGRRGARKLTGDDLHAGLQIAADHLSHGAVGHAGGDADCLGLSALVLDIDGLRPTADDGCARTGATAARPP